MMVLGGCICLGVVCSELYGNLGLGGMCRSHSSFPTPAIYLDASILIAKRGFRQQHQIPQADQSIRFLSKTRISRYCASVGC